MTRPIDPTTPPSVGDLPDVGGPGTGAPPPLDSRLDQSVLVVTGSVTSVEGATATITIEEVLKGEPPPDRTVVVSTDTPPAVGRIEQGDRGVWLVSAVGTPPQLLGGGPVGVSEEEVREALGSG